MPRRRERHSDGVAGRARMPRGRRLVLRCPAALSQPATRETEPGREGRGMTENQIKILDGNTFVVSDAGGDIEASLTDPTGLFSFDTRFLSRWVLTVNGQRLTPLSVDDLQYFETRFFLEIGRASCRERV